MQHDQDQRTQDLPPDLVQRLHLFTPEQQTRIIHLSAEMAQAYGEICDIVTDELRAHTRYLDQLIQVLRPILLESFDAFLERLQEIQESINSLKLQETKEPLPWMNGLPTPKNVEGWRDRPLDARMSQNTRPRREPWIRR